MSAAAWEDQFARWAQAPSKTESDKIANAIAAVRKALDADDKLAPITKVFVQGSYRNRVNVRQDSDVDIGVLYTGELFGVFYPEGKGDTDFGLSNASYGYSSFKNDLETALKNHFGKDKVTRGPKAFDIHENTYRVDADVVPLIVHRRYDPSGWYICGTQLQPDNGFRIVNWPEKLYDDPHWPNQHYENGQAKNQRTSRAYRAVVRILKKLRNVMDEKGIAAAKPIKGFLIECLVWNAPDACFGNNSWHANVTAVLDHLAFYTSSPLLCGEWGEVSELKYLFKNDEVKRAQAASFVAEAQKFIR